ncbi:hypothetical protein ACWCV9_15330 [Streptomyces sp. NPDC001606]
MRLCTSLSLCVAAAATTVAPLAVATPSRAADDTAPCAAADARNFPLATRIRGGPDAYDPGGGYGTWYIDLTNTTHRTCTRIHPVVVLVDDHRTLRPDQAELDFDDGKRTHLVPLHGTDEQELVGVLDGAGFDGFTVPPGRTVSVRVRLALASDAAADGVTANAAVVQHLGRDGDWVGESNAYHFRIDGDEETPEPTGTPGPRPSVTGEPSPSPGATSGTAPPASSPPAAEEAEEVADDAEEAAGDAEEAAGDVEDAGHRGRELAGTGPGRAAVLLAATATLLALGAAAFLFARRRP